MTNETSHSMVMLTGDRPTGPLHLGHYAGSLLKRVELQALDADRYVMVADTQAFTDNMTNISKVSDAIPHLVADYIGVGIDPEKTTIFLQSGIPELAELTQLYLNITTVSRLERNPTISAEIKLRQFERDIPAGFLCYPAAQAADITGFKATHVPVGDDQMPMIELAVETARRINRLANAPILPEPGVVLSPVTRLPGIDGNAKASKSLGNAIFLSDSNDVVRKKVKDMFTDPGHLLITDPGKIEGNVTFSYLDAFHPDKAEVETMKEHYQRGGLGDGAVKKVLLETLISVIEPIRTKREAVFADHDRIMTILREGTERSRAVVARTLSEVKRGLGIFVL
jgi:tryptophanyl-tRNA synthetase